MTTEKKFSYLFASWDRWCSADAVQTMISVYDESQLGDSSLRNALWPRYW